MKIIVDENIAFGKEAFSSIGEVKLMQGREICNSELLDAGALIVRSITKVDEKLLKNTPVKFIGTATIGTDHIDLEYLRSSGIAFSDAKGCNADAVAEYIFSAIMHILGNSGIPLAGKSLGVVGVGNIGRRIVRIAEAAGLKVIKNDPPVKRQTGDTSYRELNEIFDADIVTLHVPLNKEGIDKTVGLFGENQLNKLKNGTLFINASRGQVVDNLALSKLIPEKNLLVALDVWEGEPYINIELLDRVKLGTPHIAGYSLEGKVNGTVMIYNALCGMLNIQPSWSPQMPETGSNSFDFESEGPLETILQSIFGRIYNIGNDDSKLRKISGLLPAERGKYFDLLRKNYPLRREFKNYKINLHPDNQRVELILKSLGFK